MPPPTPIPRTTTRWWSTRSHVTAGGKRGATSTQVTTQDWTALLNYQTEVGHGQSTLTTNDYDSYTLDATSHSGPPAFGSAPLVVDNLALTELSKETFSLVQTLHQVKAPNAVALAQYQVQLDAYDATVGSLPQQLRPLPPPSAPATYTRDVTLNDAGTEHFLLTQSGDGTLSPSFAHWGEDNYAVVDRDNGIVRTHIGWVGYEITQAAGTAANPHPQATVITGGQDSDSTTSTLEKVQNGFKKLGQKLGLLPTPTTVSQQIQAFMQHQYPLGNGTLAWSQMSLGLKSVLATAATAGSNLHVNWHATWQGALGGVVQAGQGLANTQLAELGSNRTLNARIAAVESLVPGEAGPPAPLPPPLHASKDWLSAASESFWGYADELTGGLTAELREGTSLEVDTNTYAYQNGQSVGKVVKAVLIVAAAVIPGAQGVAVALYSMGALAEAIKGVRAAQNGDVMGAVSAAVSGTVQLLLGSICSLSGPVRAGVTLLQGASLASAVVGAYGKYKEGDTFGAAADLSLAGAEIFQLTRACFAAGTKLLVRRHGEYISWMAIEEIVPGDEVWSKPEDDPLAPGAWKLVEEVFVTVAPILEVQVGGHIIATTKEHPLYIMGKEWLAAGLIEAGGETLGKDGERTAVEAVRETRRVETVYNLRVAEYHTYFVGSDEWGFSVWAHNAGYGNSLKSTKTTTLYELVDAAGNHLKWGITSNPLTRYSQKFLMSSGARLDPVLTGTRSSMANIERSLTSQTSKIASPLSHESWVGSMFPR